MPLYEYKCDACGATFEMIQRFSDPPVEKCRVCGGPVHKLLSAPAIQFKGSGWYVTDYAKKGMSEAGKKKTDTTDSSSSSSSSEKKETPKASTDSVPAKSGGDKSS